MSCCYNDDYIISLSIEKKKQAEAAARGETRRMYSINAQVYIFYVLRCSVTINKREIKIHNYSSSRLAIRQTKETSTW